MAWHRFVTASLVDHNLLGVRWPGIALLQQVSSILTANFTSLINTFILTPALLTLTTKKESSRCQIEKRLATAPIHRLNNDGVYIVTGATMYKQHLFTGRDRLDILEGKILTLAKEHRWHLEAWSAFANHYHFVGRGDKNADNLGIYLDHLHSVSARDLNELDREIGRRVWYNYWDSELTFETSYLARLNYVHQNPVKHGLVVVANQYPWCSAAWFERTATPAAVKTIYSFKADRLKIDDYYLISL